MADQQDTGLITLEQAGRLLMVGTEWVRRLIKEGYIPRPKPGRTTIVGAVQGYIKYLKDAHARTSKTAADSRVRDARAAEIELRNAERRRELIPVEDATAAMDFLVAEVREQLNGLPARVTRDLDLRRKIEAEVYVAQSAIAQALATAAGVARTGAELPHSGTDS